MNKTLFKNYCFYLEKQQLLPASPKNIFPKNVRKLEISLISPPRFIKIHDENLLNRVHG